MGALDGKVAVITGAGRGVGRTLALAFAAEGAAVGLAARSAAEVNEVAEQIRSRGGSATSVPADLSSQADVDTLFARVRRELGEVDILVNNAAVAGPFGMVWETRPEEWEALFDVNIIALVRCVQAVVPHMLRSRRGKIINIGSFAGSSDDWAKNHHPQMAYGVTKAAVHRLTELLAYQLKPYGINVNCIGVVADTRLSNEAGRLEARLRGDPLPPALGEISPDQLVRPEENVAPFLFLASDQSDHITGGYLEANMLPDRIRRASQ